MSYAGRVDSTTDVLTVIGYLHHEAHAGNFFRCYAEAPTLGAGATLVLAFKTPDASPKHAHLGISFGVKVDGFCDLVRGPTWTNQSGTLEPIFNRRHPSTKTSFLLEDQAQAGFVASSQLNKDPTSLSGGTAIRIGRLWSAGVKVGQSREAGGEWILAPNTQYAVRLTAVSASNGGHLQLDWYEHTDKGQP
jgi:hypothetical protein